MLIDFTSDFCVLNHYHLGLIMSVIFSNRNFFFVIFFSDLLLVNN